MPEHMIRKCQALFSAVCMYIYFIFFIGNDVCRSFLSTLHVRSFVCIFVFGVRLSLYLIRLYTLCYRETPQRRSPINDSISFSFTLYEYRMRRSYVWTTDTWTLRCVWVRSFVMIMVLVCSFEFRLYNYISGMLSLVVRTICIYIYCVIYVVDRFPPFL